MSFWEHVFYVLAVILAEAALFGLLILLVSLSDWLEDRKHDALLAASQEEREEARRSFFKEILNKAADGDEGAIERLLPRGKKGGWLNDCATEKDMSRLKEGIDLAVERRRPLVMRYIAACEVAEQSNLSQQIAVYFAYLTWLRRCQCTVVYQAIQQLGVSFKEGSQKLDELRQRWEDQTFKASGA